MPDDDRLATTDETIGCWGHEWHCRAETTERNALADGWVIGLDEKGQAHYSCPNCAVTLFDQMPLEPI